MFTTANIDLVKRGIMGYAFPTGYVQRGMEILRKKIEKIPDHDIAVSIMSKVVMYEMGCACVKYGKKENKGFIAAPILKDSKEWDWDTIGTFDCTDPLMSFPGSILRSAGVLNFSQHLIGSQPIGGYMPYNKDGVMLGTALRMSDYEKYLNAYKPLNLGIKTVYEDSDDDEDYQASVLSKRNCSDSVFAGNYANKQGRKEFEEWRKLDK
jgi:hypothetical protein